MTSHDTISGTHTAGWDALIAVETCLGRPPDGVIQPYGEEWEQIAEFVEGGASVLDSCAG